MTSYRHVTKYRLEIERAIHQRPRKYPELNGDSCGIVVPQPHLTQLVSNARVYSSRIQDARAISHLIYARGAAAKR